MFQGFKCHITGNHVEPDKCLACSLKGGLTNGEPCPFTPPIVRGLIESNQPRNLPGWSVNELVGCPRKPVLAQKVDFHLEPSKAFWAFRGRLAHSIVELAHSDDEVVAEVRMYGEIGGEMITGQPDVVYVNRKLIVDYKTTRQVPQPWKVYACTNCGTVIREGTFSVRKGMSLTCQECQTEYPDPKAILKVTPPRSYSGHVAQINCYRWLLAKGWPDLPAGVTWPYPNGVEVEAAELLYLDMSEPRRVPIELWSLEDTENYILGRLAAMNTLDADGLPTGAYTEQEDAWQCDYCALQPHCPQP